MSRSFCFLVLVVACVGLFLCASGVRAAGDAQPPAADQINPADWVQIKELLQATNEEWSVIYPQLWRIRMMREDIDTAPETAAPEGRRRTNGVFDSPMGGTSLNAPVMPDRGGRGGGVGGQGGGNGPFDPKKAPGATGQSSLSAALRGIAIRTMINMVIPDQRHPLRSVMTELRTLMDSRETTDEALREKLAAVRAVREREVQDLRAAQGELAPYLTISQTALLVYLGVLD